MRRWTRFCILLVTMIALGVGLVSTHAPSGLASRAADRVDSPRDTRGGALCVANGLKPETYRSSLFASKRSLIQFGVDVWSYTLGLGLGAPNPFSSRLTRGADRIAAVSKLAPAAQIVDVTVGPSGELSFSPGVVVINVGDTVRWTWGSSGHDVISGSSCVADNRFCSPNDTGCGAAPTSGSGSVYTHTFNTAGTFPYYCRPHCTQGMSGTVTVQQATPTPTPTPAQTTVQFSATSYSVNEGGGSATIIVTRTGDSSGASSVDFATGNNNYVPCNVFNGVASQNCDFAVAAGTLSFAAGETSKTFSVLIVDDLYVEGNETLSLNLNNPAGATFGSPSAVTLAIIDNDASQPTTNPLDNSDARFFVRQHYLDFLNREPDPDGLNYWSGQITQCGSDQNCIRAKRVDVSNAFFFELEYQQTGAYVFRLYRAAFGNSQPFPNPDSSNQTEAKKLPSYAVFVPDRARVVGGSNLAQSQLALANLFVQRPEFLSKYPANPDGSSFVDAVLTTIKNDSGADLTSENSALLTLFNQGGRGAVMYRLADDNAQTNPINNRAFIDAEYNRAFVATQYFGYLRRDADIGGFLFWVAQVGRCPIRNVGAQHAMVCSFITSAEYQNQFSSIVTGTNQECPQGVVCSP